MTRCKYPLINYLAFLGYYVGEIPEDTKQICNGWKDCQFGERCHSVYVASYCVPDSCQKNGDCPNVGHVANGLITSDGCNKGTCVYAEGMIIS